MRKPIVFTSEREMPPMAVSLARYGPQPHRQLALYAPDL
jgi:hypothetical protein